MSSNGSSFGHGKLFQVSVCIFFARPHLSFSFLLFSFLFSVSVCLLYFLTPKDASGSSYIFPVLALESAISPYSSDSFYWRMLFRNKDPSAGYVCCQEGMAASGSSLQTELANICICAESCTHTSIFLSVSLDLYTY